MTGQTYEQADAQPIPPLDDRIADLAKLDIDPEALAPGYAAHVIGVGKLPCGYHASEQEAIDAGTAWLHAKAMPPNVKLTGVPPTDATKEK